MRFLFLFVLALLTSCGGDCLNPAGCDKNTPSGSTSAPTSPDGWVASVPAGAVVLRVDGTAAAADISYFGPNSSGDTNGAPLPWAIQLNEGDQRLFYLQAKNTGATGTVRVVIASGGKILNQASSNAPQGLTSVDARCC